MEIYMIKTKMSYSTEKQLGGNFFSDKQKDEITLYIPKNSKESVQITILSDADIKDVALDVVTPDGITAEVFAEKNIDAKGKLFPDPLLPLEGSFDLERDNALTLLIRLGAKTDCPTGEKTVLATMKDKEGNLLHTYEVKVVVLNFVLSCDPAFETYIPVYKACIAKHHGFGDVSSLTPERAEELDNLYKSYYDLMLSYGVSGGELPYDILDPRADAYMSDPRVTSFSVNYLVPDETLLAYYNKLKSNPVWFNKSFVYIFDEPTTVEHMNELKERCDKVKALCPDFSYMTAFYSDRNYDNERDMIQFLMDNLQLIVPKLPCYNESFIYTDEQKAKWPSFAERMEKYKADGNKVWTYVCWEPGKPYANLFVDEEGLDHRILFWQQYACGSQGFLYWACNYWNDVDDPWSNMSTVPWLDKNILGDGSLLYNGNKVGINSACPSLRLELIRAGLEDIKLLTLASSILGREIVSGIVSKVTVSTTEYTESSDVFFNARKELCLAVEEALN